MYPALYSSLVLSSSDKLLMYIATIAARADPIVFGKEFRNLYTCYLRNDDMLSL